VPRTVEEPPPSKPAYFWWGLANAIALCLAIVSWVVCLHVFRHPENPRNYEILRKLHRLPEIKHRELLSAPAAEALGPKDLYRKFFGLDERRTKKLNDALLRNYLTNFDRPLLLNYVEGSYRVEAVRPLEEKDFLQPGFVVRARAMVKPDEYTPPAPYPVVIEYVFPTAHQAAFSWFKPGDLLTVSKTPNCAAVLHVAKIVGGEEPMLCVTAVPIVYGAYQVGGNRSFEIGVPEKLQPGDKFPLFR